MFTKIQLEGLTMAETKNDMLNLIEQWEIWEADVIMDTRNKLLDVLGEKSTEGLIKLQLQRNKVKADLQRRELK